VANNTVAIFVRLAVVAWQICEFSEILGKFELIAVQGHPRSSTHRSWCESKANTCMRLSISLIVTLEVSAAVFEILSK